VKKKVDQTLTELADAAFRQAAQKVIQRAEESGTPVIIWEHGAIKQLEPRKARRTRKKKEENDD
jgi:hypothetical protein